MKNWARDLVSVLPLIFDFKNIGLEVWAVYV